MVGVESERQGIERAGARLVGTLVASRMPYLVFVVRRLYGVGGQSHHRASGMFRRYAWPSASWGSMHIAGGTSAAYRREIETADDPEQPSGLEIEARLQRLASPLRTAEATGQDIIDPRDCRPLAVEFVHDAQRVLRLQTRRAALPVPAVTACHGPRTTPNGDEPDARRESARARRLDRRRLLRPTARGDRSRRRRWSSRRTGARQPRRRPVVTTARVADGSVFHEYLDGGKRSVVLDMRVTRDLDERCGGPTVVITSVRRRLDARRPHCRGSTTRVDPPTRPRRAQRLRPRPDRTPAGAPARSSTGRPAATSTSPAIPIASRCRAAVRGRRTSPAPPRRSAPAAALFDAGRTGVGQLVDVGAHGGGRVGHQWIAHDVHPHRGRQAARGAAASARPTTRSRSTSARRRLDHRSSRRVATQWESFCIACETVGAARRRVAVRARRALRAGRRDRRARSRRGFAEHDRRRGDRARSRRTGVPASRVLDYVEVLRSRAARGPRLLGAPRPTSRPAARDAGRAVPRSATATRRRRRRRRSAPTPPTFRARARRDPRPAGRLPSHRPARPSGCSSSASPGPARSPAASSPTSALDVVKVEHPASRGVAAAPRPDVAGTGGRGARSRRPQVRAEVFPDADPGERCWNRSGIWNKMNRSKRSLCLDAKAPGRRRGARPADRRRRRRCVHNFTPARRPLARASTRTRLRACNPLGVTVAMTGYGETGPMATHLSYGPILEAYGGFDEATGYVDGGPIRLGIAFPTPSAALHGAYAMLAALWERALTGATVHVDLSQLETLLAVRRRGGARRRRSPGAPTRRARQPLGRPRAAGRVPLRRRRPLGGRHRPR